MDRSAGHHGAVDPTMNAVHVTANRAGNPSSRWGAAPIAPAPARGDAVSDERDDRLRRRRRARGPRGGAAGRRPRRAPRPPARARARGRLGARGGAWARDGRSRSRRPRPQRLRRGAGRGREPRGRARPHRRRRGGGSDRGRVASARRPRPAASLLARAGARGRPARAGADRTARDAQAQHAPACTGRGGRRPLELRSATLAMRFSRLPLLWRVFAINAGILLVGTLVLVLAQGRIHASLAVVETLDLAIGLLVLLAANLILLRPTLSPIDRLVERMRTVDLLRPGQRLAE